MSGGDLNYSYITRVIQHLDFQYKLSFFITPKDFDTLWNWSEKRIPMRVIRESFAAVIERWNAKNKPVTSFTNFKYEVRKNFKAFMELSVGSDNVVPQSAGKGTEPPAEENRFAEVERFMAGFPELLEPLREKFQAIYQDLKQERELELEPLHRQLLAMFKDNEELNVKTAVFLKNLDPKIRKPELEERYRLNFLLNKFRVPDFDLI